MVLFSFNSLTCKRTENACKSTVCRRGALCTISGRSDDVESRLLLLFVIFRVCSDFWLDGGGRRMSLLSGPAHVATSREAPAWRVVMCCDVV